MTPSTAPAPVVVLSSCAGDGRDLLDVLDRRTDAHRVTATLVEADAELAARAAAHARRVGRSRIDVRCTDAGTTDAYAGAVPADLVLLCGIFGNVADDDVHRTISTTPQLCERWARVVWTRHRRDPDLTPRVRTWFTDHCFEEDTFVAPAHTRYSVGVGHFVGEPRALAGGQRIFRFTS